MVIGLPAISEYHNFITLIKKTSFSTEKIISQFMVATLYLFMYNYNIYLQTDYQSQTVTWWIYLSNLRTKRIIFLHNLIKIL